MGVIYKLKPELKEFVLQKKKEEPNLSCRNLASLVTEKFQIKLSKSSVNSLLKSSNLSLPVGRRKKKRRLRAMLPPLVPPVIIPDNPPVIPIPEPAHPVLTPQPPITPIPEPPVFTTRPVIPEVTPEPAPPAFPRIPVGEVVPGLVILKAADYLVKGSYYISEVLKNRLNLENKDMLPNTEALLYLPFFNFKVDPELCALVNKELSQEEVSSYLHTLEGVRTLPVEVFRIITNIFQEVRCLKIYLSDGGVFYLDGQWHTVWSSFHTPYDFSATVYNVKSYINKYFQEDKPLVLFMAPGYDVPTEEFFNFILGWDGQNKEIHKIALYSNKLAEIEVISVAQAKKRPFIFGLWPWQFAAYRKVKANGEFRPFSFAPLKLSLYLAEIELELSQPNINKKVTIKGCILKNSPKDKARIVILSNLFSQGIGAEEVVDIYLSHWPNLEESFQDFSRKTELFTYTADSQSYFSTENFVLNKDAYQAKEGFFQEYLKILDEYVRWHFLPRGYETKDFLAVKERFYNLKGSIRKEKGITLINLPGDKDLQYACRRINEREIILSPQERLWLTVE
ncbi:MAG TPA: hypothetical protein VMD04_03030 [Candidatus Margulisiibacteriota bacterium]|nr:hypothetical protein [Candidatus Margulisiibacteriota bacterium]